MTANYDLPSVVEKRVRFFDGQFLQDQDFVDEQKYHLDRERRHLRLLRVAGIADGLAVTASVANQVTVAPGTAIDSDGRQLALAQTTTVDLPTGTFNLYISYRESAEDEQTEVGSRDFTRWLERPQLMAIAPGEAYAGATPPVLLARVTVDNAGRVTVDDTVRAYSGLRLPGPAADAPTLRSTTGGQVGLTGSLTVDGDLGIGTTSPMARVDIAGAADTTGQASLQLRSGNSSGNFDSDQITFGYNNTAQYRHAIKTRHHAGQKAGNAIDFYVWNYNTQFGAQNRIGGLHTMTLDGGNVGIGTTSPAQKLTVSGGKIQLDGDRQLAFTDGDTSNNLKVQLWTGYGLGINEGTLFYAANGRHSWRDDAGANEWMALTTGADGGLTVSGTGQSSFAGPLQLRRDASTQLSGSWWALELYQDESTPATMADVFPAIRFRHHNHFETTLETRPGAFHLLANYSRNDYADLSCRKLSSRSLSIGAFGSGTPQVGSETSRALVDIQDAARTGSHPTSVPGLYVTADLGEASSGIEFRRSNATQGIGFGYSSIYAAGTNANQHLNLMPKGTGGVGIGTTSPAQKLTVSGGKIQLDGGQQVVFTDTDLSNNLKLQLWTGYGLGINSGTLFYAANGRHSWRDASGATERMALTTAANGGLTVMGTGTSSFAGGVSIAGNASVAGDASVAGNVGIGATSPTSDLQIGNFQSQNRYLTFKVASGNNYSSGLKLWAWQDNYGYSIEYDERLSTGNGLHIRQHAKESPPGSRQYVASDGTTLLFVGWNGNVGVGTTTPPERLSVAGDMQVSRVKLKAEQRRDEPTGSSTVSCDGRLHIAGAETLYLLNLGGVVVGKEWNGNGNLVVEGALIQSSDARLKKRIQRLDSILDRLAEIRGVSYLPRHVGGPAGQREERPAIGVLAQEVEAVFPELVSTPEGHDYKGVDYSGLTAVLLEAVKELKAALDPLQARVAALEAHA
jgi:Chaperone of endosialidase